VTRRGSVMTSVGGEVTPGRGKGGDDANWADANLTRLKIKKIHAGDSASTNGR
jgi:hypothetical protein